MAGIGTGTLTTTAYIPGPDAIDTTHSAWSPILPAPLDLTGWTQAAASNYLCQMAGVDPTTQDGFVDSPPGPYDAVNSTEPRLVPDPTTGARAIVPAGHTLAQAYGMVQLAPTA